MPQIKWTLEKQTTLDVAMTAALTISVTTGDEEEKEKPFALLLFLSSLVASAGMCSHLDSELRSPFWLLLCRCHLVFLQSSLACHKKYCYCYLEIS